MNKFDKKIQRVKKILGSDEEPIVNKKTLKIYLEYLKKNITLPCCLTGIEDFLWEEFYVLGPGDRDEYEQMKKTRASYTDVFRLVNFQDYISEDFGILVGIKRILGVNQRHFILGLEWLKCTEKNSKNYQLIDDYSVWFCNYR
ncbi:hypothetical protein HZA43_02600 [Candidatus Peregrinibacteria bacterium]|nr:hypothetical protein [Candidatus Peregrinibacteria bacterium]